MNPIQFFRPWLPPWDEVEPKLRAAHESGVLTSGPFVKELEETLADMLGARHVICCANATLGMTILLDVALPDCPRVIVPGYTFAATQQAVEWAGGDWLWADVGEDCNIDVEAAAKDWQGLADAVLAVHVSGNPCDCRGLADAFPDIPVFYDAAHALGALYEGLYVTKWGAASVLSLGVTKIIAAGGEGGAVVTDDDKIARGVRLAINHGREAGSMDCMIRGTNARMQEYSAAYALACLPHLEMLIQRRRDIRSRYLAGLAGIDGIAFPPERAGCRATWKDCTVFVDGATTGWDADGLAEALCLQGIGVRRYYDPPAHQTTWMQSCHGGNPPSLPVTERLAAQAVTLPCYPDLTDEEVSRVIDTTRSLLG